jgi:FAD:protein FMN transferase
MPETVNLALEAMATRFEFILHGDDRVRLRAAGEEAMEEILRLEAELGFYQSASEVSRLNSQAADAPVRISPMLFQLLEQCRAISQATEGTFDITIAPLMHCWGLTGGTGRFPDPEQIATAKKLIGMDQLEMDRSEYMIRFRSPGAMLDLGSIGKGFALDIAAEWLRDAGIESALIHGGTSTAFAIGTQPSGAPWRIGVVKPEDGPTLGTDIDPQADNLLATVELVDESLSVSAIWGKSFDLDGKSYGHVIDPRSGWPVSGACLAAVVHPAATETDALATALLTLGDSGPELLAKSYPGIKSLVALPADKEPGYEVVRSGL